MASFEHPGALFLNPGGRICEICYLRSSEALFLNPGGLFGVIWARLGGLWDLRGPCGQGIEFCGNVPTTYLQHTVKGPVGIIGFSGSSWEIQRKKMKIEILGVFE